MIYLLGILFFSLVLVWSTRLVVRIFDRLVAKTGVSRLALAGTLVALSTSLPELFVGIFSGLEGKPQISLGNVLGSNIVNLSLVIGVATIISGTLAVVGNYLAWEFAVAFLMGIAPVVLLFDGELSRFDGVILLVIYLVYVRDLVGGATHFSILNQVKNIHRNHTDKLILKFLFGMLLVIISADLVVKLASLLAVLIGVSELLVSLILVAIGTSLPELALEIEAIKNKKMILALGNLLGSTVTNSTLIVGLTVLISPLKIRAIQTYAFASIGFVVVFGLFWLFTRTKRKLERWEALVLIGIYLMFVGIELFVN